MSGDVTLDELLAEERAVWEALVRGDAVADKAALAPGFLGVYSTGYSDRAGHVAQLADGPTVAEYLIEVPRLMILAPGLALLVYRAKFRRVGASAMERMYVSSIWRRDPEGWRNVFSQDTTAGGCAPV